MKKKSIYLFLFLFTPIYFIYAQQINTDDTQQPNELIQNLVGNNCANASNVSSAINGSVNNIISYGSFDRGTSDFPLQSGIVLSTGNVSSVGNPIIGEDLSEGEIDWTTDSDILNVLGIDQTLNATSIEFDFVSANNFVAFKYLFASEEYQQEYPCNFRDVFAVLIKRAGTADPYVNMALVPETTLEVSTNTIHPNINGFCEAQNDAFFQGYNLGNTNFIGNTTVLTANSSIIPNETYHIKFVIADHIDERFDSAVFIEAEGFGNSIDLGPDQSICGNDLILNADINNTTAIYTWFLDNNEITGENNPTLQVTQSGTYSVEISIPTSSGNCTLGDTIEIEIIPFKQAQPIEDILICDEVPSDGFHDFDFPLLKDGEIYNNLPSNNYLISYHLTQDDAQNNTNPITGIYQNTEQTETIFVRIESLSGDCLQIGSFNISVNHTPNTYEMTLQVCNGSFVESSYNDLSFLDFPVSNFEFNTVVTYYLTENDAINTENVLSDPPPFDDEPPFFFARVEDQFSGCPSIVPVHLDYLAPPELGIDRYIINQCIDPSYSDTINGETYNYNNLPIDYVIEDIFDEVEATYPGVTVILAGFIGSVGGVLTTSAPSFSIPIRVFFTDEYCPTYMSIEIHKNLLYNILSDNTIITKCDDPSNDGIIDLDLTEIANELKNDYDIGFQFYETEEDRSSEINPIDQSILFPVANSQSVYLSSTYNGCSFFSKFTLNINPALNLQPLTIDYCGNTNPNTNTTNITLPPLIDNLLEEYNIAGPKEIYLSQEDAENQENEITETYEMAGDQQVFFIRATNIFTSCYDITTLQVNITNAIEASNPEPLIICDDDQDGFSTINLESVIPELSDGSNNLSFTYFETYENAIDNESPISNPSNYTTESNEIFIRAEIDGLECFTIFNYKIFIYANPQLSNISDYINCDIDTNNPSSFFFENKDFEILNGQTNMQVLYFETEVDAINKQNSIDKTVAYQALSNPQTIYVRLQNETGNSCYKIAPMQIEIRQAPIFTEPTDVFECDVNNTGLVSTDLNEKITEITANTTQNLRVTFHSTPLNANVGANPLPLDFTTTSNPQLIYARIENINSGCFEVSTFYINTLSLPQVNYEQSFTTCANNYNTVLQWDLTLKEIEILNGRQYNVDFTYYRSEADLESNTNPITNPEAYTTNTSNPETVFVKVRNATTECYASVPLELIINMPPPINTFETYNICENTDSYINLLDVNGVLLDNTYNILVSYYTNLADAEANENALNTNYYYTNAVETLYTRVEYSTSNCYTIYPFQLVANPLPIANQPNDLVACDDNFDGVLEFDLSQQNSAILNGQNSDDYSISYYNSEIDANENNQPLFTNYLAHDDEIIFVRIENNSTKCYDITQFSIEINPLSLANIEDQVVCSNNLPLLVSANTYNPTDTYLWSTNESSPEIEIFEIGTYYVTITNQFGCENTSTFNVTESEAATIETTEVIDFSDPNNITVTISGIGDYLYQLDNFEPQESNVFQNVAMGYHTVKIIDLNGCSNVTKEVLVVDIPKFFTPNDDGDFDTWHIVGVETLPGTIINIFDRYGKLLKQIGSNTPGWDGYYNGHKMPTSDYWFVADVKRGNISFQVKGHFTLRR